MRDYFQGETMDTGGIDGNSSQSAEGSRICMVYHATSLGGPVVVVLSCRRIGQEIDSEKGSVGHGSS